MKKWHYPFLAFLVIGTILILSKSKPVYRSDHGAVFGTFYNITYLSNQELQPQIDSVLARVDMALSMFNGNSTIARINAGEEILPDSMFLKVFNLAMQISDQTDGAFDITVASAVNAWGFGFKKAESITAATIDSLREITGYRKVRLSESGFVEKEDSRIMLDCSAIAKGFGCDAVAAMLRERGINDYMVEIGGEIAVSGLNPKKELWNIGVNKPVEDSLAVSGQLQTILKLTDCGMATSGNYRNFYYKDGKKYAHTIDPATCMPVEHSLLSATVIAPDCATADALATSFMVMGKEKACQFVSNHPELQAYFIVATPEGFEGIDMTRH